MAWFWFMEWLILVYIINRIIHGRLETFTALTRSISMWTLEDKFHISARPCIILSTVHVPCLFLSARPLGAILNNYTHNEQPLNIEKSKLIRTDFRFAYHNAWDSGNNFIIKVCFIISKTWVIFMRIIFVTYVEKVRYCNSLSSPYFPGICPCCIHWWTISATFQGVSFDGIHWKRFYGGRPFG